MNENTGDTYYAGAKVPGDEVIDRKYKINAHNLCSGRVHTEKDSILLPASDPAVIPALRAYHKECELLDCSDSHLESVSLLIERVQQYQNMVSQKRPDTDTPCEIDRCIGGKL